MTRRQVTVQMPCTCGELVQGSLEGISFHVSCPIDVYSQAVVTVDDQSSFVRAPGWARKAHYGMLLAWLRLPPADRKWGAILELLSPLPKGKGLGSSTADVAAAITALGLALGAPLDPAQLAALALSVEPSDGSFLDGIVLFDHRRGLVSEQLAAEPPPLELVVLDFGGQVDTEEFNRLDHSEALRQNEPAVREALQLVRWGLARGDVRAIAEGATLSAIANQAILYKPQLETVIAVAREVGALGVNCAHSGTVLGLLMEPDGDNRQDVIAHVRRRLPAVEWTFVSRLVGGGARLPAVTLP